MKKFYLIYILIIGTFKLSAQGPCQLSIDTLYLDTSASDCSHLFFKYTVSGGTPVKYLWNYGDGNTCTCLHPKNFYNKNSTYQVCGRVEDINGCADSICATFTVNCSDPCDLSPIGIYSYDTLSYSCNEIEFNTITSSNTKKLKWDFGDGDSSESSYVIHQYKGNGTFKVKLYIEDSIACGDTAELEVMIYCPETHICDFKIHTLDTASGALCKDRIFRARFSSVPQYTRLEFGDGQQVLNFHDSAVHSYQDTGVYMVCLYANDSFSCADTACTELRIECHEDTRLDISYIDETTVYPTPFIDDLKVFVRINSDYRIFDSGMRCLKFGTLNEGENLLDLAELNSGIYVLYIESDGQSKYLNICKQ